MDNLFLDDYLHICNTLVAVALGTSFVVVVVVVAVESCIPYSLGLLNKAVGLCHDSCKLVVQAAG